MSSMNMNWERILLHMALKHYIGKKSSNKCPLRIVIHFGTIKFDSTLCAIKISEITRDNFQCLGREVTEMVDL